METKVKKFIRNTPEEDLKNFLISNDFIEVPEDFKWDGKNRKYHASLFGMVWGCEDAKKQNLFDTIDRVHGMSDELGQNALCSIAGNDEIFLDQKGEYARGLYMHQKFPDKFRTAEFWVSHDYKRKSKEWSSFHGPKNKKLDKSEENISKFKEEVLSHLDISRKLNLEFSCRDKKDKDGNKLEICILTGFHDGLPQSIQTFDKDEVVTRHFAPAKDFSISYDPISGLIDVISNSKDNREFLAKKFANIFLKSADDKFEIRLKKYNLAKFKSYQDLMKDVDLKDGIEDIKVTLIKLKPLNSKNSTTLESPFSEKRTIYEIAENWFAGNNPLSNSFEIKKVKLSIKFKQDTKNPRGKLYQIPFIIPYSN